MKNVVRIFGCVAISILLAVGSTQAATMNDYCITPPFITAGVQPNLLLMIDNSTSMYDVANADEGQKDGSGNVTRQPYYCYDQTYKSNVCSADPSRSCSGDSDCVSPQTCLNVYGGYFQANTGYAYDFTNNYFFIPATLPVAGNCAKSITNTPASASLPLSLCIGFDASNKLNKFVAKGNYLNWLAASKFDVEKQILNGGKYVSKLCKNSDGTFSDRACLVAADDCPLATQTCIAVATNFLQGETRGCLGQGFIKDALTTDFINYSVAPPPALPSASTDPNKVNKLGIAFMITGPDEINPGAPSQGGQTYIKLFQGNYNAGNCQDAINLWKTTGVNQNTLSNAVDSCLNYNSKATNYCQSDPTHAIITTSCTVDHPDCDKAILAVNGYCSNNAAISCSDPSVCGSVVVPGTCSGGASPGASCTPSNVATACKGSTTNGSCSGGASPGATCTAANAATTCKGTVGYCKVNTATNSSTPGGACNANSDCTGSGPKIGYCSKKFSNSCTTTGTLPVTNFSPSCGDCLENTCNSPAPVAAGVCSGATTIADGTCTGSTTTYAGTCTGGVPAGTTYYGPCINPTQSGLVKTKIALSEATNTCWQYNTGNGSLGSGDITRMTTGGKCTDVYAAYGVCSGDHTKGCGVDGDCPVASGLGGSCTHGPASILPGNPAMICGSDYLGAYYTGTPPTPPTNKWDNNAWTNDAGQIDAFKRFCAASQPSVIDPTDSAATSINYETTPALLGGIGVEAQLGDLSGKMLVRLKSDSEPTGLLQTYGSGIRMGAMKFNFAGSSYEAGQNLLTAVRVCSNDGTKLCVMDADCGSGNTCRTSADSASYDTDGGKIIHDVGQGYCSTVTTTACSASTPCSGNNLCSGRLCWAPDISTVCTTDDNCTGTAHCIYAGAGNHLTSKTLVSAIDMVRADAWTPFSEAFYNAIGYFAKTSSGKSRIGMRLNSGDYNENLNPSQYRCQQNFVLLVSDGSSTADRKPAVANLAQLYAPWAGKPSGWDNTCPNYAGSKDLPIMSWIGYNQKIDSFSLANPPTLTYCSNNTNVYCHKDSDCGSGGSCVNIPRNGRDNVGTFVVYNGGSNGLTGECNSKQLLTDTATNGGTAIKLASNPQDLYKSIQEILQEIAAKAASGTAASILSNSEGSGANILQAVFYPVKIFENSTNASWVGEMQNLWYYVDPYINNSTIREDSDQDLKLNLINDYVARFSFDSASDKTLVQLYQDTNGDGAGDTMVGGLIDPDLVKSIWRAGKLLWSRDLSASPRTIKTTINKTSLIDFSSATFPGSGDNSAALAPYLNVATADAPDLINWVHGQDKAPLYRPRFVQIKDQATGNINSGTWRLGDIISSTPRVQSTVRLNTYNLAAPGGYSDNSYLSYINSNNYKGRGMVYAGANDGMLHAFNLGILSVQSSGAQKATLSGTNLGKEMWAFIPQNALPYLKYMADPAYPHLYSVDGRSIIFDASIGVINGCSSSNYETCTKLTSSSVVTAGNNLDSTKNTWRTVVISSMGIGGASTKTCASTDDCVSTPIADPNNNAKGLGYSSYFALDVTDPTTPSLLWEFSDPALGFATSGPAIVRVGDSQKNGKWYAVFGSGPTGPIDTSANQFLARSNQTLKFFVVDLLTGAAKTIDTGIANAFSGSMIGGSIDTDRWNPGVTGNYQDDAIYVGYVKKSDSGTWTDGGVLRILTKESLTPDDATKPWTVSTVIDGIGPVTTSIARVQDKKNRNLWLFFGSGRYYYRDSVSIDDNDGARSLYGVKDPCYNKGNIGNFLNKDCSDADKITGTLIPQNSSISSIGPTDPGWVIALDPATTNKVCSTNFTQTCATDANCNAGETCQKYGAERVVTDTVALTNGTVFFTSFKPTLDTCGYGGNSFLWGVKYDTGGQAAANALQGKALIQLSTGEFKEVDLSTAFTDTGTLNRRMTSPMTGKPPSDAPPIISNSSNRPLKKILHIKEH